MMPRSRLDTVATTVGDVAQLLDVDVHQVAGCVVLVAAYCPAGGPVEVCESGEFVAAQDPVHCSGIQAQQVGDACRSPPAQDADFDDSSFGACRCLVRAVVRAAGPIGHPGRAVVAVAVGPAFGGGVSDLESFGGPSQGPVVLDDTASQTQPPQLRQRGITVGHEDLRKVSAFLDSSHFTRRSSPCQLATPSPTSVGSTARACLNSGFWLGAPLCGASTGGSEDVGCVGVSVADMQ